LDNSRSEVVSVKWGKDVINHVKEDVKYPTTGVEVTRACEGMLDIEARERTLVQHRIIYYKTYRNPGEVFEDLNRE
jgi:repressor of nif and glnA expression